MTITQDTAILIDTLASAASKIGSTDANAVILMRIKELASEGPTIPADIVTSMQVTEDNLRNCQAQLSRIAQIDSLLLTAGLEDGIALRDELNAILDQWRSEA